MKILVVVGLTVSMLAATGCATILSGKTQKINVSTSNNKPATMTVDSQTFKVPAIIDVQRRNVDMVMKATGDCQGQALAAKSINPVFFVNILSGGTFGSSTDYGTEAMWQYQSNVEIKCE